MSFGAWESETVDQGFVVGRSRKYVSSVARHAAQGPLGSFRLYIPLTDELAKRGFDVGALLERAGLPEAVLSDPDTRVPRGAVDALWQLAIEAARDRVLPLRVGLSVTPSTLGLVGYLVGASESAIDAVERAAAVTRYFGDGSDVDIAFERGLAVLRFHNRSSYETGLPTMEYSVALTVALSRLLGPLTDVGEAVEARFAHAAPDHAAHYALLGLPVRFGASHDGAAFRLARFHAPNPNADPVLRGLLEQHAADLLSRMPREDSFADRVRVCVVDLLPAGSPGVQQVAETLRMSARTLRRRLSEEKTTYRDVLDDVRHALALAELGPQRRSVEEVAYRLGFSDASGFHKAFRRWTGVSPADYARSGGKPESP